MNALTLLSWLYLLPMGVVLLPGVLAFDKLGEMDGVKREDIQLLAILPLFNLYTAFCIIDVVITSVIGYIKEGR